ncbi:hypothetical protein N9164_07270 [Draconibacterium sp.]|nr:hypothetical protein [Draconibacterium sp.]
MEYTTVYEYTLGNSKLLHLIPLLILSIFGFGLAIYLKKLLKTFSYFRQFLIFICYMIGGIPLIMMIVMFFKVPDMVSNEQRLKETIETKSYKVINGQIEDFSHRTESGHVFESFKVQGVMFEYSDYIINEGFHQTSKNGGPIKKNGQQVRISYITKENENLILKLEIKSNKFTD